MQANAQQDVFELGDPDLVGCTTWAARPMAEWRERGYVPDSDDEDYVGLGAASSPKVNPVPVASQEFTELAFAEEKIAWREEPEQDGGRVSTSSRYDGSSQDVEKILAEGGRPGDDEALAQAHSFVKAVTGDTTGEYPRSDESQLDLPETTNADDALPAASVTDQLQAELEHGLQSVKEILGDAYVQSRSNYVIRSQTSSPLSSIRSFTDNEETVEGAGHIRPVQVQPNRPLTAEPIHWDYQNGSPPRYPGRDLRQRNPIQLHPYALEDARYQQELKARGLKPVRIGPGSSGISRNLAAEDTGDQYLFSSSPNDESAEAEGFGDVYSILHSQDSSSPAVSRVARPSKPLARVEDDDELPELSVILEGDISGLHPSKRRKVAHKSSKEAKKSLGQNEFHIPELPPADLDRAGHEDMEIDMFEIPPSPTPTCSSNVSDTPMVPSKTSGPNERTTPRGLPTPIASSLTKAPPEPETETEYSPDSSEGSQLDEHSVTGSSTLAADMHQGKGIQSMQRRMKGVLPASWLTLDLDKQTTKSRLRRPSAGSPVNQHGAKGVAQRLKPRRSRTSRIDDRDAPKIEISDDSSSETGRFPSAKTRSGWDSSLFEEEDDFGGPSLDEVVEDNGVDMMAPPLPRSRKRVRWPANRQRTLDETFHTNRISHSGNSASRHKRKKQLTSTGNAESRREHRHHKPMPVSLQVGILEAPAFTQLRVDDQPQFLKIAARRARTRRKEGRSGQLHQHMRSKSEADRQDVRTSLFDGRESRVRSSETKFPPLLGRNSTPGSLLEYQLSPQTCDLPNSLIQPKATASNNPDQIASLKTSTAATIHRILLRQAGSPASATLDDRLWTQFSGTRTNNLKGGASGNFAHHLDDASVSHMHVVRSHSLPRRLLSHYQNRSGKGRLIQSLAQERGQRSAQLEVTESGARARHPLDQLLPQRPGSRKRVPGHRQPITQIHRQSFDHPAVSSPSAATAQLLDHSLPRRPPGAESCAAILQKGEMPSLKEGTFYHESTFIGNGDLARTVRKVLATPRNFELNAGQSCSFSPPQTGVLYNWGPWNPTVASQLSSVFQILFREYSTAMNSQRNALRAISPRLMLYMRTVIGYINDVLYFAEATARVSFVTTCIDVLLSNVIATQGHESTPPEDSEGDVLHILNHVAVFSFQVCHIASTPTVEPSLQLRAWNLFDTIVRRVLSLALGSRGRLKLNDYLERNKIHSERERGIRMDYPEVDALVIVSHLCRGKISGESCSTMVSNILTIEVEGHDIDRTHERLVEVMAFLWTVAPYSTIDASGCLSATPPTADKSSCWPVIVAVFGAFLKSRIRSPDATAPHNIIGRRYVNFCLRLATGWGWVDCAGVVQLLRIYYGSNNMDALFAEKRQRQPRFS